MDDDQALCNGTRGPTMQIELGPIFFLFAGDTVGVRCQKRLPGTQYSKKQSYTSTSRQFWI